MLSPNLRAALEGADVPGPVAPPIGSQLCPGCGRLTSQLDYDEQGNLAGPLYEHRSHGGHAWPQLHSCHPRPDDCPFCKDCPTC